MKSLAQIIRDTSLSPKDSYRQGFLALVFFVIIILAYSYLGLTLPMYLAVLACALIFFLPSSDYLGLVCILGLTMIFEKIFALQPLVIGDASYKIYPIDALMIVVIIALFINLIVHRAKLKFGWPEAFFAIFLVIVAINMVRGLGDMNSQFETAFSSFKNYLWYPLIYFITVCAVNTREKLKNFIKLFLLFAITIIGFIAYGIVNGQGLWTEYTPLSTEGFRILGFTHAFYLGVALIFGISLLASRRFKNVLFTIMILWIWLIGIVGSMMRHLWLGLALALAALFVISPREEKSRLAVIFSKNIILLVTIVLMIILALNIFPTNNSFGSFSGIVDSTRNRIISFSDTGDDTSATWRIGLWRDAIHQWQANPLFGIGFGKQVSLETLDWRAMEDIKNIHNSPLAILVQTGLIGFGAFALFILLVFISAYKNVRNDPELRPYYAGIFCAVILFLFCSLFQPYLEANFTSIALWILLGLLSTSRFIIKPNENPSNQ